MSTEARHRGLLLAASAACALNAAYIAFTPYTALHHADSLIPILVSVAKWTPFYWGQDRFGMLIPLLAWPVRSPYANLVVQTALWVFCGELFFFLLPRWLRLRNWAIAGAIGNALFLLQAQGVTFTMNVMPYLQSMTPLLIGLLLLEPGGEGIRRSRLNTAARVAGFVVLGAASLWVSPASFLQLGPLIALRTAIDGWRSGRLKGLLVRMAGVMGWLAIATKLSLYLSSQMNADHTTNDLVPMRDWWNGAKRLYDGAAAPPWPGPGVWSDWYPKLFLALCVLGLAPALVWKKTRRDGLAALGWAAVCACAAAGTWLIASASAHVLSNGYAWRYIEPALVLLLAITSILAAAASPVVTPQLKAPAVFLLSALALGCAGGFTYGPPKAYVVSETFRPKYGALAQELVQSRCALLYGDYWTVWPAVFEARQRLYSAGEKRAVFALSTRSASIMDEVAKVPPTELCVAIPNQYGRPPVFNYPGLPPLPAKQALASLTAYGPP
ncbi:MAG: hypothetical protein ACJ790_10310 [Myxococcaceae bacterium]